MTISFAVRGDYIQLDQVLKATGLCHSGGFAHAEIDDILGSRACAGLRRIDLGEDIGRQAADAVEVLGHGGVPWWKGRDL